ncbi:MAG: hypothetical protein QW400_00180 [Candidatus Diapherotrites archaeon]
MKNRGQGTTEYLIILAVIIIIALVVAGVMGWFPGLGGAITEQQSKAYWQGTSPIAVTDWQIGGNTGNFTLKNVGTEKITVIDINLNGKVASANDLVLNAGESKTLSSLTFSGLGCNAGSGYQYPLIITYRIEGSTYDKKLVGAKPIVGTCG